MKESIHLDIEEYIKKSITDIARKCHVCDTLVIQKFKSYADNFNE